MATQVQNLENRFSQRVLQFDAIYEFIVGAGLLFDSVTIGRWLSVNASILEAVGVAVLAYGALLLYLAERRTNRQILQVIAILNIAFVVLSALVLVAEWNTFANEGRWLITLAADVGLVLGLVELYARRFVA